VSSLYCCLLDASSSGARADALAAGARACSPRIDPVWDRAVIFDAAGLERAVGPPELVARQVSRLAVVEGLTVRVAIAARMTAAWLLANANADLVVAVARPPADSMADLSLEWLETLAELDSRPPAGPHGRWASRSRSRDYRRVLSAAYAEGGAILRRWGLRTMGELARLNPADIHARLGPAGTRLHQAARGDDARPLGSADVPPAFLERVDLEWPIEGLEPLAFVLARPVAAL
jgi:protein ImuB